MDKKFFLDTVTETREEVLTVYRGTRLYGGSFAKALGEALLYADDENIRRIHDAFPEFWKQYSEMGKEGTHEERS